MSAKFNDRQKSLKRRFLLILGLITFVLVFAFGVMVMFWNGIVLQLSDIQRKLVGGLIIVYAILRFSRIIKKERDE